MRGVFRGRPGNGIGARGVRVWAGQNGVSAESAGVSFGILCSLCRCVAGGRIRIRFLLTYFGLPPFFPPSVLRCRRFGGFSPAMFFSRTVATKVSAPPATRLLSRFLPPLSRPHLCSVSPSLSRFPFPPTITTTTTTKITTPPQITTTTTTARKMSTTLPPSASKRLQGKTVLITGASSGIGRSCALEFARAAPQDLKLVLTARREDRLKELAEEIRKEVGEGVKVWTAGLDVADKEAVRGFVGGLPEEFKGVDVLVNNA